MIRKLMASAAVVALSTASLSAFAADPDGGDIHFQGKVLEKTCTIAINGVVSPSLPTITLPDTNTTMLQVAGNTTGETPFTLNLKDCKTNASNAEVRFTSLYLDGNQLRNTAPTGPAGNVALELTDNSGNPLDLQGVTPTNVPLTAGAGSAIYKVRYYAKAAVTPGAVESTAMYIISYP